MPRKKSSNEEVLRGIPYFFAEREKLFKEYNGDEKIMLLQQCGTFFEIYGFHEEDDPIFEYYRIMDCAPPWWKAKLGEKDVYCCGHNTASIDSTCRKLAREGWHVKILKEIGPAPENKKKKAHGHLKTISPGTLVPINNNKLLTNNCVCVVIDHKYDFVKKSPQITIGVSSINTMSGCSKLYEYKCLMPLSDYNASIFEELDRFISINIPKEVWIIHNVPENRIGDIINFSNLNCDRVNILSRNQDNRYTKLINECNKLEIQKEILLEQFQPNDPDFWYDTNRFEYNKNATFSYCLLLKILSNYDNDIINKLTAPTIETLNNKLIVRTHGLRQLNILDTQFNNGPYSSVLRLINKCKTNMGKREFKNTIVSPTNDSNILVKDYNAIEHLLTNNEHVLNIRSLLSNVLDIERLYRKFVLNQGTPLDIAKLYDSFIIINQINDIFDNDKKIQDYITFKNKVLPHNSLSKLIKDIEKDFNIEHCKKWDKMAADNIFFNRDIYIDLDKAEDKWINTKNDIMHWKETFESIIKVENSVHLHRTEKSGVFLRATAKRCGEVTKYIDEAKKSDKYQTMNPPPWGYVNLLNVKTQSAGDKNKKFMSYELTELYKAYSQTYDNIAELLNCKFKQFVRNTLLELSDDIRTIVNFVKTTDIIFNKAFISNKYNYCKPYIDFNYRGDNSFFDAKNLRHPLVEHIQTNEVYVANDISIGLDNCGMCLFGVNTSGKSTIIKSVGIAIIMAQAGMFVPASEFTYKPYNTIFTRILSNDNLFKCLSSFGTEMSEFQYIEEYADENSLVLGDELCNGTETDSAVAIFAAGLMFLNERKSSHIFATHLHAILDVKQIQEINTLDIKHLEVIYDDITKELIYKRTLTDGVGKKSYGLEVCKQFNFSKKFLENAHSIRNEIQERDLNIKTSAYSSKKIRGKCEFCGKDGVEMHHLNPQELASENGYIGTHHKNHKANLANVCKECHHHITVNKIIHERVKTSVGYKLIEIGREK